jgi:hypothetical protein
MASANRGIGGFYEAKGMETYRLFLTHSLCITGRIQKKMRYQGQREMMGMMMEK